MTTTKLLRVPEAAAALGLGRRKMYELLEDNSIESVKIGRARRIPADALDRFIAGLRDGEGDA